MGKGEPCSMTQQPSYIGFAEDPRASKAGNVWGVQLTWTKKGECPGSVSAYSDSTAFMRLDACQVLWFLHMLFHFTLTTTPGGQGMFHRLWMKKKKRPQWGEASHSWSGMLLHSKAKNFDPHIQKFFFHFMYWETHQAICFNIYISLRLEFWVACFSTYHTPDQVGGERNRKGHVVWTNWLWESQMKI